MNLVFANPAYLSPEDAEVLAALVSHDWEPFESGTSIAMCGTDEAVAMRPVTKRCVRCGATTGDGMPIFMLPCDDVLVWDVMDS